MGLPRQKKLYSVVFTCRCVPMENAQWQTKRPYWSQGALTTHSEPHRTCHNDKQMKWINCLFTTNKTAAVGPRLTPSVTDKYVDRPPHIGQAFGKVTPLKVLINVSKIVTGSVCRKSTAGKNFNLVKAWWLVMSAPLHLRILSSACC